MSFQFSPIPLDSSATLPYDFDDNAIDSDLDMSWLSGESLNAAEQIDDFASLFLQPTASNSLSGGGLAMKDEITFPSPKSLTTTTSFGLSLEDVYADVLLVEKAIPFLPLTPSNLSPTASTILPSETSKLALSVPDVPTQTQSSLAPQYVSKVLSNSPEEYILSPISVAPVAPVSRPQPKRKRNTSSNKGDESYPTDGKLLKTILDNCVNKSSLSVPSLGMKSAEELTMLRNNRALARKKLTIKQIRSKENNFNGHYPDRKKVASSRKRVGGRFVKENKAVFRPAQSGI